MRPLIAAEPMLRAPRPETLALSNAFAGAAAGVAVAAQVSVVYAEAVTRATRSNACLLFMEISLRAREGEDRGIQIDVALGLVVQRLLLLRRVGVLRPRCLRHRHPDA